MLPVNHAAAKQPRPQRLSDSDYMEDAETDGSAINLHEQEQLEMFAFHDTNV